MIETAPITEKAVLVGLISSSQDEKQAREYLDELEFLTDTAGAVVLKKFTQKLDVPNTATFVGTGKLEEIRTYIKAAEADTVIFDDELTPTQLRNIERSLECKVLDRTNLILDIFAKRAKTAHAKTQVELAQYQYLLPRLTRMWTHLERQQGGIGMRGPGETQIETDRRIIALVGYTNVGKSTIMNMISKSEVFAENKLFATLDTTVRKVVIGNLPFLLADTVGFIRKLPHGLVESFKSTLDEVREADILLHVVDISHPGFEEQIETVISTLQEINAGDKPIIFVFNKIDIFTYTKKDEDDLSMRTKENFSLEEWKNSWMAKHNTPALFISAKLKENLEDFKSNLYDQVKAIHSQRFPYNDYLYNTDWEEEEQDNMD